ARAAGAIEERYGGIGIEPHLGTLGYHHSKAGSAARAAEYFERAGGHARKHYANQDAHRFFRLGLAELDDDVRRGGAAPAANATWCRLQEALGDMLLLD